MTNIVPNARIAGWGRYPVRPCELERPERYRDLLPHGPSVIARGQGRSYGDAAVNENGRVILTERLNRFLDFDPDSGVLRAEAGTTVEEVLHALLPGGWFLPVTPGTQYVSLGGCVAADVHGKNHHHDGTFGNHVRSLELVTAEGKHLTCSPERNPAVFWATIGGMGLTGLIGEVELQLMPVQSAYMVARHHVAADLDQMLHLFTDPALDDRYSVAWIDCLSRGTALGRGIYMTAHHAKKEELPSRHRDSNLKIRPRRTRTIPFDLPSSVLNPYTIGAFNAFYYWAQSRKAGHFVTDYGRYFYPLDGLRHWNRLYGKKGFLQYQCVIPEGSARQGIRTLLEKLSSSRRPSFLAVLKRFGAAGQGMLSFPMPGFTLALDLPLRDAGLFGLLESLDEIVLRHGGRVYLAKDARLSADTFRKMYPRYPEWLAVKQSIDPENRFSSSLARRLRIGERP